MIELELIKSKLFRKKIKYDDLIYVNSYNDNAYFEIVINDTTFNIEVDNETLEIPKFCVDKEGDFHNLEYINKLVEANKKPNEIQV